ncbi:MAG: RNA pseudouridine synthase [Bacteroidota bacterium]
MDFKALLLHESKSWLAINKPSGLIVEKSPFEQKTIEVLAWQYLQTQVKRPYLGIVHRLDRVTSGVLLLAKKKSSLRLLNQQFAKKTIQKTYYAIVPQTPEPQKGHLQNWLEKQQKEKRAIIHEREKPNTKQAILEYKVLDQQQDLSLLEIKPQTGRFHQIRAQLAHIGCPIVGDEKYGSKVDPAHRKIALHAGSLSFIDPETEQSITIKAPFPEQDHWFYFKQLLK